MMTMHLDNPERFVIVKGKVDITPVTVQVMFLREPPALVIRNARVNDPDSSPLPHARFHLSLLCPARQPELLSKSTG